MEPLRERVANAIRFHGYSALEAIMQAVEEDRAATFATAYGENLGLKARAEKAEDERERLAEKVGDLDEALALHIVSEGYTEGKLHDALKAYEDAAQELHETQAREAALREALEQVSNIQQQRAYRGAEDELQDTLNLTAALCECGEVARAALAVKEGK